MNGVIAAVTVRATDRAKALDASRERGLDGEADEVGGRQIRVTQPEEEDGDLVHRVAAQGDGVSRLAVSEPVELNSVFRQNPDGETSGVAFLRLETNLREGGAQGLAEPL